MKVIFLLQIVDGHGVVVRLPGGTKLEQDLVGAFTEAIASRGVGYFKSEATVKRAIREGITETIRLLKAETRKAIS